MFSSLFLYVLKLDQAWRVFPLEVNIADDIRREKMGDRPEFLSTFAESPDCLEGICHTQNQVDEGIEFVQKSHGCDFVFW